MKLSKCIDRDRRLQKRKKGHQEDGRSVFTIKEIQKKRALRIRQEQLRKEELLEGE
jgi:hypothetical protein